MARPQTKALMSLIATLMTCHFARAQMGVPKAANQIDPITGRDRNVEDIALAPAKMGNATATARLYCVFQRLKGDASEEGLWLTSTVPNQPQDRFRVKAIAVGREETSVRNDCLVPERASLSPTGIVSVEGNTVRFRRPGLAEEYSASMDGVRQDFVVLEKPARRSARGQLRVGLAVRGATVEQMVGGARLILEKSGRKIAYSRLHVSDATGKELPARMEINSVAIGGAKPKLPVNHDLFPLGTTTGMLAIVVDDTDALYPVRIDPTFSDANWISMGGINGADTTVSTAAVDGSGNLYIGGKFTVVGEVVANRVAKWNGSAWSALGSGMNDYVTELAVIGKNVYAGGAFTNAGGAAANRIAKWDGSAWSALSSGMDSNVLALAVLGSDLYAGGSFTNAGGLPANYIAKWDGTAWSALGSGMNSNVNALMVSGTDLYAGGRFTTAGGSPASCIAKWNGSAWSGLGSGITGGFGRGVNVLATSGTDIYAAGAFTAAGGTPAKNVARWDGSSWAPLGSGVTNTVLALAVSGTDLYAGCSWMRVAGGSPANYIVLPRQACAAQKISAGYRAAAIQCEGRRFGRWANQPRGKFRGMVSCCRGALVISDSSTATKPAARV